MKKSLLSIYLISMLLVTATSWFVRAESNVGYFGFEPDIITNYIGQGNK
ncbi:MAG: flagellar basal body-associated protein FliL, partial [Pseudoalteromonadaceae bacterium]|nr:flagellar basal body-associated protein FliL [Pseudoalteromonadaceae bacterium]